MVLVLMAMPGAGGSIGDATRCAMLQHYLCDAILKRLVLTCSLCMETAQIAFHVQEYPNTLKYDAYHNAFRY